MRDLMNSMPAFVLVILAVVFVVLTILAIFMPWFVWEISCDVRKMRLLAEKRKATLEHLIVEVRALREAMTAQRRPALEEDSVVDETVQPRVPGRVQLRGR